MEKTFSINGTEVRVQDYVLTSDTVTFKLEGKDYSFKLIVRDGHSLVLDNGSRFNASVATVNSDGESMVIANGREAIISCGQKKIKKSGANTGGLTSPMPGKIFKIIKEAGSDVKKGEAILILEAMKMEHSIRSDKDGKVKKINFKLGELVQGGVTLAEVE